MNEQKFGLILLLLTPWSLFHTGGSLAIATTTAATSSSKVEWRTIRTTWGFRVAGSCNLSAGIGGVRRSDVFDADHHPSTCTKQWHRRPHRVGTTTFVEPTVPIKTAVLDASTYLGVITPSIRVLPLQHKKFRTFEEMVASHNERYGDDDDKDNDAPVAAGVLVDFYSPLCGPCKLMQNELMSIRQRLECLVRPKGSSQARTVGSMSVGEDFGISLDNAKDAVGIPVYHIDTNKFPQVGARNNVRGLPTLVLFVDGKEVWRNEGLLSGEDVVTSLTTILQKGNE
jgi:thiol-disulfide isomerase/thioredoxin